ncbi:antirestriction protein ArdA, partial [Streptococcus suis]
VDYDFNFSDCYLLPDVTTRRELGEYWVDELGIQNIPRDQLEMYFDYEAYGRDIDFENQGGFSEFGWVDIH